MPSHNTSSLTAALTLITATSLLAAPPVLAKKAPGGYVVSNTIDKPVAAPPNATQIRGFLPQRGVFTFPSPWNSLGVRITNSSDCSGEDCVNNGYNYYEKANNSAGSNTMLIIAGLHKHGGATLFKFNKQTDKLTKIGPIFSDSQWQAQSTEQMSFSLTKPYTLYVKLYSKMYAVDLQHMVEHGGTVRPQDKQLVYDLNKLFDGSHGHGFNGQNVIWSPTVSKDDTVFGAIVENNSPPHSYFRQGCMAYSAETNKVIAYFPAIPGGSVHSCILDKSGTYLSLAYLTSRGLTCG